MHKPREAMWAHNKKLAIYKPGRESSSETKNSQVTLILDFYPPELWEDKCLMLKPPSLWNFAMAAQED